MNGPLEGAPKFVMAKSRIKYPPAYHVLFEKNGEKYTFLFENFKISSPNRCRMHVKPSIFHSFSGGGHAPCIPLEWLRAFGTCIRAFGHLLSAKRSTFSTLAKKVHIFHPWPPNVFFGVTSLEHHRLLCRFFQDPPMDRKSSLASQNVP